MKTFYVYIITNKINGKIYVGKTDDIKSRLKEHKTIAKNKTKGSYSFIHKAMNKYGHKNFTIEAIYSNKNEKTTLKKEIQLVKKYKSKDPNTGYNLTDGGEGISGYKYTKKQLAEKSKRMKGKYIGKENPFYGKKHSKKTKKLLSNQKKLHHKLYRDKYIGANHSQSKLTEAKVKTIRRLYLNGKSQSALAKKYNVSRACIGSIVTNRTWTHVKTSTQESNSERAKKYWDKKLGKLTTKKVKCQHCYKIFVVEYRKKNKLLNKKDRKYCSKQCLMDAIRPQTKKSRAV